ncbi:piggyBac transposable element-derived protein 4-like [Anthonomus grandis grandis]|uniref:piggyBac transposable element-derived protein 4-like n=1 Tax=Anthonomus grandis grandis TaxID=2921223 RepID=UPI002166A01F|nr:piggyBac transposable element-derived protein 4-like [Anthonomus grandis grandis]
MGIKKLPSYKDYWSSRLEMRDPLISSIMSRDRFSWMLANLHLNDNSVQPGRDHQNFDKLYKLRPLLDVLSDTYKNALKPSQHQAIDESMIRFKGRSSLKQYTPKKPVKRGYKVWIRSENSGYVCQFQIYTGKIGQMTEKSLGGRVVRDLTRDLVGKGYEIYIDNYFNSVELQKQLQTEMIYACGTVRKDRKNLPTDLLDDKQLTRGEFDWRVSTDGLTFLKWMDNRPVHFLTNYLDPCKNQCMGFPQKKRWFRGRCYLS